MRGAALGFALLLAACGGAGISEPAAPQARGRGGAVEVHLSFEDSGALTPPFEARVIRVERGVQETVKTLRPYFFDGAWSQEFDPEAHPAERIQMEIPIGIRVDLIAPEGRDFLFYSVRWTGLRSSRFRRCDPGLVLEMPVVSEVSATGFVLPEEGAEVSIASPRPHDRERLVLHVPGPRRSPRRREEGEVLTRWAYLMDFDVEIGQSANSVETVLGWVETAPGKTVARFDSFHIQLGGPPLTIELPEIVPRTDPNSLTVERIPR